MFTKVLQFTAAMLLLTAWTANAMICECGDMSPADCKAKLAIQMDSMFKVKFIDMMKMEMTKMMDMFGAVKNEMPADGMHAKTLMEAMDNIKTQMTMMDKMDGMTTDEIMETIQNAFMSMQPDFKKAQTEDAVNMEKFNEMMEKHRNLNDVLENAMLMMMMNGFEMMVKEMYPCVREEDKKEYPAYAEISDMTKEMLEMTSQDEKMTMMLKMMKKVIDFHETPFMKAMMSSMFEDPKH